MPFFDAEMLLGLTMVNMCTMLNIEKHGVSLCKHNENLFLIKNTSFRDINIIIFPNDSLISKIINDN